MTYLIINLNINNYGNSNKLPNLLDANNLPIQNGKRDE